MTNWKRIHSDQRDVGRDAQRDAAEGEDPDFHARVQDQIGGDHAGDGARRADQRDLRTAGAISP